MSENPQPDDNWDETSAMPAEVTESSVETSESEKNRHDHDDRLVDEWEEESFPASDPPGHY